MKQDEKRRSAPGFPTWALKGAGISGGITLIFFMALVLLTMFGHPIPPTARFPAIAVLALGVAMATAFLGGDAVAKGHVSVPFLRDKPVQFSVVGGIAVFVIIFLIANAVYPQTSSHDLSPAEREVSFLQDEVLKLKGAWENMDQSPADRTRVAAEGPKLGRSLLSISDVALRLSWRIVKYEYVLYAFTMAASAYPDITDKDRQEKEQNADEGLTGC